jgi:MFS family permease
VVMIALSPLGAASTAFPSRATTLVKLRAEARIRGRVMSLLGVAIRGTGLLGRPLMGWLAEVRGIRAALALGGVSTPLAALLLLRDRRSAVEEQHVLPLSPEEVST